MQLCHRSLTVRWVYLFFKSGRVIREFREIREACWVHEFVWFVLWDPLDFWDQMAWETAGASFQLFLGGGNFFIFFNATGLLKNWKKTTLYLYVVIWRYSYSSLLSFFLFLLLFFSLFSLFSFFFSLKWRPWETGDLNFFKLDQTRYIWNGILRIQSKRSLGQLRCAARGWAMMTTTINDNDLSTIRWWQLMSATPTNIADQCDRWRRQCQQRNDAF